MNASRFLIGILFSAVLFGIVKFFSVSFFGFDGIASLMVFYALIVIVSAAVCRRMGVLNYFEAMLIAVVWMIFSLLFDYYLTVPAIGKPTFVYWQFWLAYPVSAVAVLLFHKKAHVQARKAMAK